MLLAPPFCIAAGSQALRACHIGLHQLWAYGAKRAHGTISNYLNYPACCALTSNQPCSKNHRIKKGAAIKWCASRPGDYYTKKGYSSLQDRVLFARSTRPLACTRSRRCGARGRARAAACAVRQHGSLARLLSFPGGSLLGVFLVVLLDHVDDLGHCEAVLHWVTVPSGRGGVDALHVPAHNVPQIAAVHLQCAKLGVGLG